MSYAQVIVRFANVSNPATFVGVNSYMKLKSGIYGTMSGYPAWNVLSGRDGGFAIHTQASATAESYRSQFIKTYGPNGSWSQNDITVSPVMASTDPTKPYYIVIDFNYYVGEPVTIQAAMPL